MRTNAAQPTWLADSLEQPASTKKVIAAILPGCDQQAIPELRLDTMIAPNHCPLRPTRRLVVLIPEGELDESALARRIWLLASQASLKVLFLGLSPDQESASDLRRRLALLAAAVHQGEVDAQANVVMGKSWLRAVEGVMKGGDLLVCLDGHKITRRVIVRTGLGDALAGVLQAPVYQLGGFQIGRSPALRQRVRSLAAWCISLAILIAFTGVQIWLSQNANSGFTSVLLGLLVIIEGIAIFKTIEWIG